MGMYDRVKIRYPLPSQFHIFSRKEWQTKDFKLWDPAVCEIQDTHISENGKLYQILKDSTLKRLHYTGTASFVNTKGDVNKDRTYKWTEIFLTFDKGVVVPDSLRVDFCGLLKNKHKRDEIERG